MTQIKEFEPFELPVKGQFLIEASAGTGKTYAITSLYLRWILGIDCPRPYKVEEILVVTFTNAATDEVRGRIRKRLVEASRVFGQPDTETKDDFIRSLPNKISSREALILLQQALHSLDEAPVHTIHSFCARVLNEFAMDTGNFFNTTSIHGEEEKPLLKRVATDIYNHQIRKMSGEELRNFRKDIGNPEKLLKKLEPLLRPPSLRVENSADPGFKNPDTLESKMLELRKDFLERLETLRDPAQLSTDDLAGLLIKGLKKDEVRRRLVERFPIAMVDEFQDTDEEQLQVFEKIYADTTGCLIAIGDPKQAIYGFRGADVYTYFKYQQKAKEKGRQFTLNNNYRSEKPLLEIINKVFSRENAFLLGELISYRKVHAIKKSRRLLDGKPLPAFTCFLQEEKVNAGENRQRLTRMAVEKTAQLLRGGKIRDDSEQDGKSRCRRVQPKDIAFLVRSHNEARLVRKELQKLGIGAVQTNEGSVFSSDSAQQLVMLLRALLNPHRPDYARAVCATELFCWSLEKLHKSRTEDGEVRELEKTFAAYRKAWQERGILPMLNLCLAEQAPDLVSLPDGERRLTDLRHLGELLRKQEQLGSGGHQLYQWLVQQCREQPRGEAQQLRLDSDQNLVQLTTMHSAKGLEYEIVMLPFGRFGSKADTLKFHVQDDLSVHYDLAGGEQAMEAAEQESLAEDMQLLYVAMTRARLACFLGIGKQKPHGRTLPLDKTAVGSLLQLHEDKTQTKKTAKEKQEQTEKTKDKSDTQQDGELSLQAQLEPRFKGLDVQLIVDDPAAEGQVTTRMDGEKTVLQKPRKPEVGRYMRVLSYTSLLRKSEENQQPGVGDEGESPRLPKEADEFRDILPAGSEFGIFSHRLLELMRQDFSEEKLDELLPNLIRRHGRLQTNEDKAIRKLKEWLAKVGKTKLSPLQVSLEEIPAHRRRQEMEFHFSLPEEQAPTLNSLNKLLKAQNFRQLPGGHLELAGLMKGVIDLTFEADRKIYLADYKSNLLAKDSADYTEETLQDCMKEHHYHLQLLLYTLALHRYLKRKPGYSYARDFGGAFYLFLRGMDGTPGRGVYFHKPAMENIEELDWLFTEGGR